VHYARQEWFKPIFPLFLTWLLMPMVYLPPPPPPIIPVLLANLRLWLQCHLFAPEQCEFRIFDSRPACSFYKYSLICYKSVFFNRNSLVSVRVTLRNGPGASLVFPSASLTLSNDTSCTDNCPVPLILWFCFQAFLCANPLTLSLTSFLRWFAIAEANSYLQQDTAPTT